VLVGRDAELGRLLRLLADARLGRSGSLVLRGDAGVGKTAVLEAAIAAATGFLVLRTIGIASEAEVPFAGLDALLRPILRLLDAIPPTQARALRGALALDETETTGLAAYAGALSLLSAAAERGPVLVAIDDAQWLDRLSVQALTFAARRVAGEGIALVFAVRSEGDAGLVAGGVEELEIGALSDADALQLLHRRWGDGLGPGVARRLVSGTGGNPLALLEVATLLSEGQRRGIEPLGDALPVTESVERGVRRRLATLRPATRDALLLAAAGGPLEPSETAALEPAEDAGLVRIREGQVTFEHPLMSAAIYGLASVDDRRRAHRLLAERLAGEEAADRRAWHLAAAADGPDEAVAETLEAVARRAEGRGGFGVQAQALTRAAELSPTNASRARRLLAAATAAYWAGDSALAMDLAEAALALADEPILHAAVLHRLAIIADWHGQWQDRIVSTAALEREAVAVETLDPPRAVGLLGVILQRRFQALETHEALELAERRAAMSESLGHERRLRALQDLARATGLRGQAQRCSELCDEILARAAPDAALGFATNIAEPLLWLERYDECRRLLTASTLEARAQDNVVRLMFELTNLALLDLRTGAFARSLAGASEVAQLALESGNDYLLACNLAVLTRTSAMQGDLAGSREQGRQAMEIADRLGDALIAAEVNMALAESALATGAPSEAIGLLEDLRRLAEENGVDEPSVLPFAPDLIEAYARAGRLAEAQAELDRLEAAARAVGRRWALAAAARCRGVVAGQGDIDAAFGEALDSQVSSGWSPFQGARTQLLYGERLRRVRRRIDARIQLRAAIATFDRLGAGQWSERARSELEATGETIARRDPTAPEKLTSQELQIALQVAEGRSNREAAEALFLSPKTVEFHLTRVYRKLDVNSRAELIRLFAHEASASHVGS
jgi:DNA-binding CsgD family transcriptional regulator